MKSQWEPIQLGKILRRADRFESRNDLMTYQFAGTYSYARGIFLSEKKDGASFSLDKIQRIHQGDFVYCKIMAWEGAFGLVPIEANNAVMSGAFVAYEIDTTVVMPKFIEYYFKIEQVWKQIGGQSTGTNIRRRTLHPSLFETALISLPPLDEQRRIVARIEALADRIAEARGLRQEAVSEAELLWFEGTEHAFLHIAEQKQMLPIGETFTFRNELIHPTDGKSGEIRFIGLQHVEPNSGKRIGEDKFQAEELKGRKFYFAPGDIVYGYLRPYLNKVWIADCDGYCSVDQYVLQPRTKIIETQYLAYYMRSKSFLNQAIELTHNLQLPRLRSGLLASIPIPLPDLTEQQYIITYLDNLHARVEALKRLQAETQAELDSLLPSVLDKAFKGEL